jgi:hypothetical protein
MSTSPLICSQTGQYTFCAPDDAPGDYFVAIPENQSQQNDIPRIRSWFGDQPGTPQLIEEPLSDVGAFEHARVYRVTDFIPKIISTRNGTRDDVVGPNCYQTALTAAGYPGFQGRYVHTDEFRYYLRRDFTQIYCPKASFGSLVVYDTTLIPFDAGDHAAFHLLGSLIFQKGGWQNYYPYEISTMEGAMQDVDSHWRPAPEDRFGGPPTSGLDPDDYKSMCYDRRTSPLQRNTSSTVKDREWFLPLFQYYNDRLEEVSRYTGSNFKENRIALLTIENMWRVLREFGDRVGNFNPLDELLTIDDNIVQEYLKLESYSWQYDVMSQTYDPKKNRWQLEDLYRERYVLFDKDFYEELKLYLRLMKVPEAKWDKVIKEVEERIRSYDPVQFAASGGAVGIPYFDILKDVISQN